MKSLKLRVRVKLLAVLTVRNGDITKLDIVESRAGNFCKSVAGEIPSWRL